MICPMTILRENLVLDLLKAISGMAKSAHEKCTFSELCLIGSDIATYIKCHVHSHYLNPSTEIFDKELSLCVATLECLSDQADDEESLLDEFNSVFERLADHLQSNLNRMVI